MQFEDGSFDTVVALHVLEHVQNPSRMIAEIDRILRPGGHLFVVVPCISHIKARLAGRNWKYFAPPAHLWYFTPKTLSMLAENFGFETVHTSGLYHRAHARLLARKPDVLKLSQFAPRELRRAA